MEYALMLLMIGVISATLIGFAIVLGRREDRERGLRLRKLSDSMIGEHFDPDAHLGRCGTE
jgi:hypothetical protein